MVRLQTLAQSWRPGIPIFNINFANLFLNSAFFSSYTQFVKYLLKSEIYIYM